MWPFSPRTTHALPVRGERHSFEGPESRLLRLFAEPNSLASYEDFHALATVGYRACAIVRACVDEIASSVSEPRLLVERWRPGDQWEEVSPHGQGPTNPGRQLARLLLDPAGDRKTSSMDLRGQLIQQHQIFGNGIMHKRRHENSRTPGALEILRVPYVEPVRNAASKRAKVTQIKYRLTESHSFVAADTITIPIDDIIHIKHPDPLDSFWGLAKMVSALAEIDLDKEAITYLRTFFKNGGTPAGILKLKGMVPPDERRRLKADMKREFGDTNRHSFMVLDQDAEYETVGTRPDHLKLGDSVFDVSESRTASVFGVPPIIIGVRLGIIRGTYSNYASARTSFWNETLRPMYEELDQTLTLQLAYDFGQPGEYRIRHDLTGVKDLQESQDILWKRAQDGYNLGIITRNEARKLIGLAPDTGGEHYKTKTSDSKPAKPAEIPDPVKPEPKPAPGAAPAKKPAAKQGLQLVDPLEDAS